jgi:hypothetical protein
MEGAMRTRQYTLTSKEVQQYASGLLQHYLRLKDYSKKCTAVVLLHVLFAAAARLTSILGACQRLRDAPSDQTIRDALAATLPEYAELQRRVNRALVADLPKALRRRRQRMGIDLNLQPYYGKPYQDPNEIYRSQAKQGTNNFHAYATMYVVRKGLRYTVALTAVCRGESMVDVVKRLRQQAAKAGVRPKLLLLDRGFYSVEVIRYLQAARTPFLMPAIARGRKPGPGQEATGIRAFKLWKKGGWGEHTLVNSKKCKATVKIAVYCGNYRGQRKRHGRYAWVYAYWGFRPGSLRWVADTYRLRFGIETSYRQMNQARIRTCTRNPVVRFLLVALAFILRNVWVFLHWEVLSSPRRGERLLRLERLAFKTLLHWLLLVAESALGVVAESQSQRPPPTAFIGT